MSGTFEIEQLRQVVASSLFKASGLYQQRSNGDLQYNGHRPGPDWHAHGYFKRQIWVTKQCVPVLITLWKQRWFHYSSGKTCHSRAPNEAGSLSICMMVLFLKVFAWLDSGKGWKSSEELIPGLEAVGTERTVSRWLHLLLPQAMNIQQAIRLTLIERSEPRPLEMLFPGGLSPPFNLLHRSWRDPTNIPILWRALALLFGGAIKLQTSITILLVEARRRKSSPKR